MTALTVGGGHDLSLLPPCRHWSSDSEQISKVQVTVAILDLLEFLQLSSYVKASWSTITMLTP